MTRQREGPPDGTRRTLEFCASEDTLYNTSEGNSPNAQFQGPRASDVAETVAHLHFRRNVERVHGLGARAVAELLAEVGAERSIQHLIDRKVERYADLDPDVIQALGGDQFASTPLTVITSADEEPAP